MQSNTRPLPEVTERVKFYRDAVETSERAAWKASGYPEDQQPTITLTEGGKRYWKLNVKSWGQTSVHCFVEKSTGDIFKAATYKAPAKGARGNIFNDTFPTSCRDYYRK